MPELRGTTEKEVLSWCAEFRKGRVKNARAREWYRRFMKPMPSTDAKFAKDWAKFMFNNDEWGFEWGFADEKREALNAWARHVEAIVEGRTADVVSMQARKHKSVA